jgi:hypothetical protein
MFTVFAKARACEHRPGDNGPGGSRLAFHRCGRAWSVHGSTHTNLTAKDVERLRNEPELESVLVFEEPCVDVVWDDE